MAEATIIRNNALPYPVYGLPYTVAFPFLDADGDLVSAATTPDAEISKNGDTFADCTNESTEIATTSGMWYLSLTGAELTCDIATIIAKSATAGMKTTPIVLYPRKLPILLTSDNAGAYDSTTTINLGSSASAIDDFYNGCIVSIYGGEGVDQVRMITDYVGSTKLATVHVAWATNPDATSDLKIYRTELSPYVISPTVLLSGGTGTGQISLASGAVLLQATQTGVTIPTVTTVTNAPTGMALDSTVAKEATLANATYGLDALHTHIAALPTTGGMVLTDTVEGTLTVVQVLRIVLAALAGKTTGGGTTAPKFRDVANSKDRIAATVDSSGNRTAVTLDGA